MFEYVLMGWRCTTLHRVVLVRGMHYFVNSWGGV